MSADDFDKPPELPPEEAEPVPEWQIFLNRARLLGIQVYLSEDAKISKNNKKQNFQERLRHLIEAGWYALLTDLDEINSVVHEGDDVIIIVAKPRISQYPNRIGFVHQGSAIVRQTKFVQQTEDPGIVAVGLMRTGVRISRWHGIPTLRFIWPKTLSFRLDQAIILHHPTPLEA